MNGGDRVDVVANTRIAGEGRELLAHPDVETDGVYDVWVGDGRISDIAPAGALRRRGGVLDAQGAWLVPGLWDHHVHSLQWALAQTRLSVEHAASPGEAAWAVRAADVRSDGRRVGVRVRDGLWTEPPSLAVLDEATGEVPTYLVNSDLHSVWLNSAAFRREGVVPPDATGILREEPAFAVQAILNAVPQPDEDAALDRVVRQAAARGVVGIQDLEIAWNADRWRHRVARGHDALRVRFDVYPHDLGRAIAEGLVTGQALDGGGLVQAGMLKVISDGSLGTRTAATSQPYPGGHDHGVVAVGPEELVELVTRAAGAGIATTVHAIGDVANRHALDAFAAADVPGRIEHAQLVARSDLPRFARLGVSASVQPEHALDDRDLVERSWDAQTAVAYPLRELAEADATVLLGSDAPVAPLDPWISMAAAVFRARDGGEAWRPHQALDARTALAASTDGGSTGGARILPGGRADLVLVAHDPLAASAERLRAMPVHATLLGGRITHLA
ncbi:amidohydrolase family protein [Microbacterium betulae]|uniref:Amidohydrolase family protein n=1 Tax=Microbacterium betulae TaxID=2981139 RepID=A0AA97I8E6_9MICO|nr:amidohydrolase family protein [Microbacterium sp. AB]WOF24572.1 amidohydrolase family protein [Microbacterium sp. AB]